MDCVRSYEGQEPDTIVSTLASEDKIGEFISQKEYQSFLDAHKPPEIIDDSISQEDKLNNLIQILKDKGTLTNEDTTSLSINTTSISK